MCISFGSTVCVFGCFVMASQNSTWSFLFWIWPKSVSDKILELQQFTSFVCGSSGKDFRLHLRSRFRSRLHLPWVFTVVVSIDAWLWMYLLWSDWGFLLWVGSAGCVWDLGFQFIRGCFFGFPQVFTVSSERLAILYFPIGSLIQSAEYLRFLPAIFTRSERLHSHRVTFREWSELLRGSVVVLRLS